MLPTPSTSHVNYNRVYEPAEDSFLFLDTISSSTEITFLSQKSKVLNNAAQNDTCSHSAPLIVEIGTGSGVLLAFLTANARRIFGTSQTLTLGTDVNLFACRAPKQTVTGACKETSSRQQSHGEGPHDSRESGLLLACLNADLGSALRHGQVDVLLFNPPYVPSAESADSIDVRELRKAGGDGPLDFETESRLLALSYEGGVEGMEVTNRLLKQIPQLLHPERGVAYILLCRQNQPHKVMEKIRAWGPQWAVEVVGSSGKQAGWEKLQILRIWRERVESGSDSNEPAA